MLSLVSLGLAGALASRLRSCTLSPLLVASLRVSFSLGEKKGNGTFRLQTKIAYARENTLDGEQIRLIADSFIESENKTEG